MKQDERSKARRMRRLNDPEWREKENARKREHSRNIRITLAAQALAIKALQEELAVRNFLSIGGEGKGADRVIRDGHE